MERVAKYIYRVYTEGSFSKAAKGLFISQPALSMTISKFEEELGYPIFDRKTKPLSLTPQGKIYIETLEEIIECEAEMERRIRKVSDAYHGSISVGGSNSLSHFLLSRIYAEFHELYPHVHVTLDIDSTASLKGEMKSSDLDLLFTYASNPSEYDAVPVFRERMIIVMHRSMKGAEALLPYAVDFDTLVKKSYPIEKTLEDLSVFRDIPFLGFQRPSATEPLMRKLLGDYRLSPCEILHQRTPYMHYYMMCTGVGALMTSDTIAQMIPFEHEHLLYFIPRTEDAARTLYIASKKGVKRTPACENFIEVAKRVCQAM